jgi:RND family efflux transporter MFP subunit
MSCGVEAQLEPIDNQIPIRIGQAVVDEVTNHYITIGEVVPKSQVDVVLSQVGIVDTLFVNSGDYVEVDSPLLALENDLAETTLDTTESQLRTIRDNLALSYNSALENYNKQKILYESGATSKNQLDSSYDQLLTIQRQYADARKNYNNQVGNLKDSVDDLTVKSPIAGQVASVYVTEGQSSANQLALTIIENDQLFVKTMVSSDLKRMLSIGDEVNLMTEVADSLTGSIANINELPDPQSKLYEVRILVTSTNELFVGDYTEVIFTTEKYEALLVPSKAVVRKGIEQFIWVYKNEILEKVVVETGLSKGDWIEIKNIDEVVSIVIGGQNNLSTNDEFKIIE